MLDFNRSSGISVEVQQLSGIYNRKFIYDEILSALASPRTHKLYCFASSSQALLMLSHIYNIEIPAKLIGVVHPITSEFTYTRGRETMTYHPVSVQGVTTERTATSNPLIFDIVNIYQLKTIRMFSKPDDVLVISGRKIYGINQCIVVSREIESLSHFDASIGIGCLEGLIKLRDTIHNGVPLCWNISREFWTIVSESFSKILTPSERWEGMEIRITITNQQELDLINRLRPHITMSSGYTCQSGVIDSIGDIVRFSINHETTLDDIRELENLLVAPIQ